MSTPTLYSFLLVGITVVVLGVLVLLDYLARGLMAPAGRWRWAWVAVVVTAVAASGIEGLLIRDPLWRTLATAVLTGVAAYAAIKLGLAFGRQRTP